MNSKLRKTREDYIKDQCLSDSSSSVHDITDDDISLHTGMQTIKEIKALRDSSKAYLAEMHSSLRTIKAILIFWSILGGIGMLLYIINTIKSLQILGKL